MQTVEGNQIKSKSIFNVPIVEVQWDTVDELNQGLLSMIYDERKKDQGVKISNRGGWQSKTQLFERNDKIILDFKGKVIEAHRQMLAHLGQDGSEENLKDWEIEAWANINQYGHSNSSHDHTKENNLWSGIYYVDNGGNVEGIEGETVFEDRHYTSNGYTVNRIPSEIKNSRPIRNEYRIKPKSGMMVLFPGILFHRVDPYKGKNERITIAFNLRHKNFGYYDFDSEVTGSSSKVKMWLWYNFRGGMRLANFLLKKVGAK